MTNFAVSDRPTAALLADSLDIVGQDEMRIGLLNRLRELGDDHTTRIAIPVLSLEDIRPAHEPRERPVAYCTFQPGGDIPVTPGSEALVGNLIRELAGSRPNTRRGPWLHPMSELEYLRTQRCRCVVLVTDYSGSGTQAIRYADTFTRNKTIRSWRSLKWIHIVVLAFAVSREARERIEAASSIDELFTVRPASSFATAPWTSEERSAIKDLCIQNLAPGGRNPLGYADSAGLFAMHSGVPNNLPAVLTQTSEGWRPFFERRVFPPDLAAELGSYTPVRDPAHVAEHLNQARLAAAIASGRLKAPTAALAAVLALLRRRKHGAAELAEALHDSHERVERLLRFLVAAGLITPDHDLTPAGARELQASKGLPREVKVERDLSGEPYYPQTLR